MPNFLELIAKGAKEFKGALKDAKSVIEDAAKGVARTAKGDRAAMKDALGGKRSFLEDAAPRHSAPKAEPSLPKQGGKSAKASSAAERTHSVKASEPAKKAAEVSHPKESASKPSARKSATKTEEVTASKEKVHAEGSKPSQKKTTEKAVPKESKATTSKEGKASEPAKKAAEVSHPKESASKPSASKSATKSEEVTASKEKVHAEGSKPSQKKVEEEPVVKEKKTAMEEGKQTSKSSETATSKSEDTTSSQKESHREEVNASTKEPVGKIVTEEKKASVVEDTSFREVGDSTNSAQIKETTSKNPTQNEKFSLNEAEQNIKGKIQLEDGTSAAQKEVTEQIKSEAEAAKITPAEIDHQIREAVELRHHADEALKSFQKTGSLTDEKVLSDALRESTSAASKASGIGKFAEQAIRRDLGESIDRELALKELANGNTADKTVLKAIQLQDAADVALAKATKTGDLDSWKEAAAALEESNAAREEIKNYGSYAEKEFDNLRKVSVNKAEGEVRSITIEQPKAVSEELKEAKNISEDSLGTTTKDSVEKKPIDPAKENDRLIREARSARAAAEKAEKAVDELGTQESIDNWQKIAVHSAELDEKVMNLGNAAARQSGLKAGQEAVSSADKAIEKAVESRLEVIRLMEELKIDPTQREALSKAVEISKQAEKEALQYGSYTKREIDSIVKARIAEKSPAKESAKEVAASVKPMTAEEMKLDIDSRKVAVQERKVAIEEQNAASTRDINEKDSANKRKIALRESNGKILSSVLSPFEILLKSRPIQIGGLSIGAYSYFSKNGGFTKAVDEFLNGKQQTGENGKTVTPSAELIPHFLRNVLGEKGTEQVGEVVEETHDLARGVVGETGKLYNFAFGTVQDGVEGVKKGVGFAGNKAVDFFGPSGDSKYYSNPVDPTTGQSVGGFVKETVENTPNMNVKFRDVAKVVGGTAVALSPVGKVLKAAGAVVGLSGVKGMSDSPVSPRNVAPSYNPYYDDKLVESIKPAEQEQDHAYHRSR